MPRKNSLSIALMGDAMLHRDVQKHFFEKPQDFAFTALNKVLQPYDLRLLNLENPVGVNGTPHPVQQPRVTFCSHPDTVQILKNLHIDAVTLANNHMLDYGEVALAETLEYLDRAGIGHVGAGRNETEANAPLRMEVNGIKIAILGYVFIYSASTLRARENRGGVSDHRIERILPRIAELKQQGYLVLVTIHWGQEYSFYPIPYQSAQARQMIDAGATLIIGHGPHYPQGIEDYGGGRIIYSLGNFIFDEPYFYANRSFIYGVRLSATGEILDAQIYPFRIEQHIPQLLQGRERSWLENRILTLGRIYAKKDARFWQKVNDRWFRDLMFRCRFMKSWKFLSLPPKSFYRQVNYLDYLKYSLGKVKEKLVG